MLPPVTAATVRREVELPVRLPDGSLTPARLISFDGLCDGREHVALALGDPGGDPAGDPPGCRAGVPLVRLHSECLTGDAFGSERCDCGPQLQEAVARISRAGGYLLYLRQEGRGIGLYSKLDAYALQEAGLDTYEANLALGFAEDERDYTVAAQMLFALGVERLDLLSNNPDKAAQLEAAGIRVQSRVPTGLHVSSVNGRYLATKARRWRLPDGGWGGLGRPGADAFRRASTGAEGRAARWCATASEPASNPADLGTAHRVTEFAGGLRPVPESRMALDWLASYSRDRHLETSITRMGRRVREIVPQCLALSLGLLEEGLTFTLVSESREAAVLDAIQYLDGGPCVDATENGDVVQARHLPTDEEMWHLFSRAQSVAGVAATLSLPILRGDKVVCGVNLYASEPNAFDGHHEELADACGAWAEGVVTNADMTFTSRLRAAAAPTRLRDNAFVDAATGFLAAHLDIDTESAVTRIRDASVRAGVTPADVARFLLNSRPETGV